MKRDTLTQGVPIKVALLERGLLQRDLARLMGMPLSTLNMKIRGERTFAPEERERLSEILGKPVETLLPSSQNTASEHHTQGVSSTVTP